MNRPKTTWLIFAGALLAATATVGWLTLGVLRAERMASELQQQALLDNRVRVALWRLDSVVAPLLALESSRSAYAPPGGVSPKLAPKLLKGSVERNAKGQWTLKDDVLSSKSQALSKDHALAASEWWQSIPDPLGQSPETSLRVVNDDAISSNTFADLVVWPISEVSAPVVANNTVQRKTPRQPAQRAASDIEQRQQFVNQVGQLQQGQQGNFNGNLAVNNLGANGSDAHAFAGAGDSCVIGQVQPLWVRDELVLARKIRWTTSDEQAIECSVLNWPEWERVLKQQIESLFPQARLVPNSQASPQNPREWQLVSLPISLEPNHAEPVVDWPASLIVAWTMLVLAAAAVGGLLWQTLSLSERRAAFVSAVTHELRTPLTTFRLYTEMLSDGLVPDPEQQQSYFRTLAREANRLTHMVENVLSFARLERGRTTARNETLAFGALCDRCLPRLELRVTEASLAWQADIADDVRDVVLTTNVTAIEQVLFNLVDNSCKYALETSDPRLILAARHDAQQVVISLRDFGPGLSSTAENSLFQAFEKSSSQAAETAPGVGLGLSLSRRLARDLGGDLICVSDVAPGVQFELRLPL